MRITNEEFNGAAGQARYHPNFVTREGLSPDAVEDVHCRLEIMARGGYANEIVFHGNCHFYEEGGAVYLCLLDERDIAAFRVHDLMSAFEYREAEGINRYAALQRAGFARVLG